MNKKVPAKISISKKRLLVALAILSIGVIVGCLYFGMQSKDVDRSSAGKVDRSDCFTYDKNSDEAVGSFVDAYKHAADASLTVYVGCGESPRAGLIVTQYRLSLENGKIKSTQFSYAAASQPSPKEHHTCTLEVVGRKNTIVRCGPDIFNVFSTQ